MNRLLTRVAMTTVLLAATVACASSTTVNGATTAIASQIPGCHLRTEEHIKLGPFTMAILRGLAGLAGDDLDEEDAAILADIRRVEVATYSLHPPMEPGTELSLATLEHSLLGKGWSPMIRENDAADFTWVYIREGPQGEVEGLFVVSVDSHEVEVVKVEGSLDRMIAEAIAEDRGEIEFLIDS